MKSRKTFFIITFVAFFAASFIAGYFLHQKSKTSVAKETLESTMKAFNADEQYKVTEDQLVILEKSHSLSAEQIQKLRQALNQ